MQGRETSLSNAYIYFLALNGKGRKENNFRVDDIICCLDSKGRCAILGYIAYAFGVFYLMPNMGQSHHNLFISR